MQISKHIPKNIKTYKQEKNIEAQKRQCLGLSAVKAISFKSYEYTPQYIKRPREGTVFIFEALRRNTSGNAGEDAIDPDMWYHITKQSTGHWVALWQYLYWWVNRNTLSSSRGWGMQTGLILGTIGELIETLSVPLEAEACKPV